MCQWKEEAMLCEIHMHDFRSHFQQDFLAYCTRPVSVHLAMASVSCLFNSFLIFLLSLILKQQNLIKIMFSCIHFPIWPCPPQIIKIVYFVLINCINWQVWEGEGLGSHAHPTPPLVPNKPYGFYGHEANLVMNAVSYKHCWLHHCELLMKCQMGLWEWCMQDTWFQERCCMQCTWFRGILEKTNQRNGSLRHQLNGYPANIMASPTCLGLTQHIKLSQTMSE